MVQQTFWTDDRKDIVREYWATKTNSQIAAIVGDGATRCSVSGVALRMGLKKPKPPPAERKPRVRRKLTEAEKKLRKMPKPPSSIIHGEDIPPLLNSVLELTGNNCAYPYGMGKAHKFCGRPREFGSFCAEHAFLCYQPVQHSSRLTESSKHHLRPRYR